MRQRLSRLRRDRGAVIVVVAAFMTSAIALVTFVVDVGHWFEHKRHLQSQVDAGALAGATEFNRCVGISTANRNNPASAANIAIRDQTRKYAGDTQHVSPALNAQVNNQAHVTVVMNSSKYPGDGGADNDDPAGPPCQSAYVDVKSTDANLPLFFASSVVPKINAHARVSIFQVGALAGSLPLAVEDIHPLAAGAIFVDEDASNAILARNVLTAATTPTTLNGQTVTSWTGGAVSVHVSQFHIGVVIALCSNKTLCGGASNTWLTGPASLSAICAQVFVTCKAAGSGASPGLEMIQGYNGSGTGTDIVRGVTLSVGGSGACTDNSAPYFVLNGDCKVGGLANLDFGVTGNPTRTPANGGVSASVTLTCNGSCKNNADTCALTWNSTSGTVSSWSGSNCLQLNAGAGRAPITLTATWTGGAGGAGNHSISRVIARPFVNDGATGTFFSSTAGSYPIAYAQISQGSDCAGGAGNSLQFGDPNVCVGVGVLGNLQVAANISDPTRVLKFFLQSHTGAVDCGNGTLEQQIEDGCGITVQPNPGEVCPNTTTPPDCLPIFTGKKTGQVTHGMEARFGCTTNNWVASNIPPGGTLPKIPDGDPRVVPLIVTLAGAFAGSGGGSIPVTDFAAFYVTGWSGSGCALNEAQPSGADNQGSIWGHFITYVGDLGNSIPGTGCTFSGLTPCIPVMTD